MQASFESERLLLDRLTLNDFEFIQELVNSPGWIQFIGNRDIHSEYASKAYIQKILDNEEAHYWVVRIKQNSVPIGIITFMLRSYLSHYDLGFAFLSEYTNQGYAFEASQRVLEMLKQKKSHDVIQAITLPGNGQSINLLEKLGFNYESELDIQDERLLLYAMQIE
jgi:ribosomal-protein-alanine N-acetyltransferase